MSKDHIYACIAPRSKYMPRILRAVEEMEQLLGKVREQADVLGALGIVWDELPEGEPDSDEQK